MDEIKRADSRNLLLCMISPLRLIGLTAAGYVGWLMISQAGLTGFFATAGTGLWLAAGVIYASAVRQDFYKRRFENPEHKQLWDLVEDRRRRFQKALKRVPEHIGAGLQEMLKAVERTSKHLYESLRRADMVKKEITKSEGSLGISSLPFQVRTSDKETTKLYSLADRNVVEYRKYFEALNAKVTRTEGQCALFISALDSLRVQLLGHRLSAKEAAVSQEEFISTIQEIQGQLDSINLALDELDLSSVSAEIEISDESRSEEKQHETGK